MGGCRRDRLVSAISFGGMESLDSAGVAARI